MSERTEALLSELVELQKRHLANAGDDRTQGQVRE